MRTRGEWCMALAMLGGCWSPATYRAGKPVTGIGAGELVLPPAFPAPAPEPPTLAKAVCEPIPTAFAKSVEGASALPQRRRTAAGRPEEFARDAHGDHWLQGRISRVPVGAQCRWLLRYAPAVEQNPFAGAALLEGYLREDWHDGDLVQVAGSFLPTPTGRPAAYRCTSTATRASQRR